MLNQLARNTFYDTKRQKTNLEKFTRQTNLSAMSGFPKKTKKRLHKLNGINGIVNGFSQKRDMQTERLGQE